MTARSIDDILTDLTVSTRNTALAAAALVARLYGAPEEACERILMLKAGGEPKKEPVDAQGSLSPVVDTDRITVCDKCLKASCWQGIFMCDEARTAGTIIKTVAELRPLGLEHQDYWR